jgi:hypothetical protein
MPIWQQNPNTRRICCRNVSTKVFASQTVRKSSDFSKIFFDPASIETPSSMRGDQPTWFGEIESDRIRWRLEKMFRVPSGSVTGSAEALKLMQSMMVGGTTW